MTGRINEDIRFYLPADPYYYKVDNLPLEDLISNDKVLQQQIDDLRSTDISNAIPRSGFLDLSPFIDTSIPGTVTVRPGNFIGRTNRDYRHAAPDATNKRLNDGIKEIGDPATVTPGTNTPGDYNIEVPASTQQSGGMSVGRTSVFQFLGDNITIDGFDYDEFGYDVNSTSPPQGRLDLIGITTADGAMDSPQVEGNDVGSDVKPRTGLPQLAVVKGAGITYNPNTQTRELVVGKKYITLGTGQENINTYGHDLDGNVVPNPDFGTVPAPDDIVNVLFAREDVAESLWDWAHQNRNANFFLPIAYVYVPQTHIAGNPIPQRFLKDIRPFFRTAELTLQERQALMAADNPSITNPVVTNVHQDKKFTTEINRRVADGTIQSQIDALKNTLNEFTTSIPRTVWANHLAKNGGISGSSSSPERIDVTAAIQPEHVGLNITKLYVSWYPRGNTGDIGAARLGMMNGDNTPEGSFLYAISYGLDTRHSTMGRAASAEVIYPPITVGSNYYIDLWRSGSSQSYYVRIMGYEYLQDITI